MTKSGNRPASGSDPGSGDVVSGDKVEQRGDNNIGIIRGKNVSVAVSRVEERSVAEILAFVAAVKKDLALVDLDGESQARARAGITAVEKAAEEKSVNLDRLRAIARSLRAILEGAAGDTVAGYLLSLWKP